MFVPGSVAVTPDHHRDSKAATEHLSTRPTWDCQSCHRPWPCATAREAMLTEFDQHPTVLAIYMSGQLTDAFNDLTANDRSPPPNLYDRFLAWVQSAPAASPTRPDT